MKFNALAKKAAKAPAPLEHGGNVEVEDLIRFVLEQGAEGAGVCGIRPRRRGGAAVVAG